MARLRPAPLAAGAALLGASIAMAASLTMPSPTAFPTPGSGSGNTMVDGNFVRLTSTTSLSGSWYRSTTGSFGYNQDYAELRKDSVSLWSGVDTCFDNATFSGHTNLGMFHPNHRVVNGTQYRVGPFAPGTGVATLPSGKQIIDDTSPQIDEDLGAVWFLTGAAYGASGDVNYVVTFDYETGTDVVVNVPIAADTVNGVARNRTGAGYAVTGGAVGSCDLDEVMVTNPDPARAIDEVRVSWTNPMTGELRGPIAVSFELPASTYDAIYDDAGLYLSGNSSLPAVPAGTAIWYGFRWGQTVTTGSPTRSLGDITLTAWCGNGTSTWVQSTPVSSTTGQTPGTVYPLTGPGGVGFCVGTHARYQASFTALFDTSPQLTSVEFLYDSDLDNDGVGAAGYRPDGTQGAPDCDDNDPAEKPGLPEICGDGKDNDCNGVGNSNAHDEDSDGLTNAQEGTAGTDICDADTDNDTINDGAEVNTTLTNPLDADHDDDGRRDDAEDADKNGVLGAAETNPKVADTDGDGLNDGLEVGRIAANAIPGGTSEGPVGTRKSFLGTNAAVWQPDTESSTTTNPRDPDSDDDGLCDGPGTVGGLCVPGEDRFGATIGSGGNGARLATGANAETDPNDANSDDDGWNDKIEHVDNLTDPLDADTDNDGLNDGATGETTAAHALDADRDDDGIRDGLERQDSSSLPCSLGNRDDADTDNDGLTDGLECGLGAPRGAGTSDVRGVAFVGTASGWVPDALTTSTTLVNDPDTDNDGLCDGNLTVVGVCVNGEDTGGGAGGAPNGAIEAAETDPNIADTDGDGVNDKVEAVDNGTDPRDSDSDNDGVVDGSETLPAHALDADVDDDGVRDGDESLSPTTPGQTRRNDPDTDDDGLNDGLELGRTTGIAGGTTSPRGIAYTGTNASVWQPDTQAASTTLPNDADTDNDGLCDGSLAVVGVCAIGEDRFGATIGSGGNGQMDGTGANSETDANVLDTDADGWNDKVEHIDNLTDPRDNDTDNDGVLDGSESSAATAKDADQDDDGISDGAEQTTATLPSHTLRNNADTDGDGLNDGLETGRNTAIAGGSSSPRGVVFTGTGATWQPDTQPATTTLPNDADSDDDGLCDGPNAVVSALCVSGEDRGGATVGSGGNGQVDGTGVNQETNPNLADTDGDGRGDGPEQVIDQTDPLDPDTDDDGMNEGAERTAGTNPKDADSDDDGIKDGDERSVASGGTGTTPLDNDFDDDGLNDGLELRRATPIAGGTSAPRAIAFDGTGTWQRDEDTTTGTNPLDADTDDDGLCDGNRAVGSTCAIGEDELGGTVGNGPNGKVDGAGANQETNPNLADTDSDGHGDGHEERVRNTDPLDPDTDNDTLLDGAEIVTSPLDCDHDNDGLRDDEERPVPGTGTSPTDDDSDDDLLTDGLELGRTAPLPGGVSSPRGVVYTCTLATWQPDLEPGTTTNPNNRDSDVDGRRDGIEDANKNGRVDVGETNPNDNDSDDDGLKDGIEDANDNGVVEATETNPVVADTDGDRRKDGEEDLDGDHVLDPGETLPLDPDTDDDLLTDGQEVIDAGTNPRAADSDGDGVRDDIEVGPVSTTPRNTDGTGPIDALDTDDDDDTVPTAQEDANNNNNRMDDDADQDGIPDFREIDDDNDGARTPAELAASTDHRNNDTDRDGLLDGFEFGANHAAPRDSDVDNVIDALDDDDDDDLLPTLEEILDNDGDGTLSAAELLANDKEGCGTAKDNVPNHLDIDSDGDGICDGDHPTRSGVCTFWQTTSRPGGGFSREDGFEDRDSDVVPNVWDCDDDDGGLGDSDDDGISNVDEVVMCAGAGPARQCLDPSNPDTDGDGLQDGFEVGADPEDPVDSDNDGVFDALDDDDDNDGVLTRDEDYAAEPACPGNGDGDSTNDDTDLDLVPDYLDEDDDDDGVSTFDEDANDNGDRCDDDFDQDGLPDYLDAINDGPTGDSDGDGLLNGDEDDLGLDKLSVDSDGDGVPDEIEIGDVDAPQNTDGVDEIDALDTDDDNDGIPTDDEGAFDVDADATPNYLDTDSDGDGAPDSEEGTGDTDGDGAPDFLDNDAAGEVARRLGFPALPAAGCSTTGGGGSLGLAALALVGLARRSRGRRVPFGHAASRE